jgi:hypothetical protein
MYDAVADGWRGGAGRRRLLNLAPQGGQPGHIDHAHDIVEVATAHGCGMAGVAGFVDGLATVSKRPAIQCQRAAL